MNPTRHLYKALDLLIVPVHLRFAEDRSEIAQYLRDLADWIEKGGNDYPDVGMAVKRAGFDGGL